MERSPAQAAYSRKFVFKTAVPFVAVRMAFLSPWSGHRKQKVSKDARHVLFPICITAAAVMLPNTPEKCPAV
jgi:hypothetical protein